MVLIGKWKTNNYIYKQLLFFTYSYINCFYWNCNKLYIFILVLFRTWKELMREKTKQKNRKSPLQKVVIDLFFGAIQT